MVSVSVTGKSKFSFISGILVNILGVFRFCNGVFNDIQLMGESLHLVSDGDETFLVFGLMLVFGCERLYYFGEVSITVKFRCDIGWKRRGSVVAFVEEEALVVDGVPGLLIAEALVES